MDILPSITKYDNTKRHLKNYIININRKDNILKCDTTFLFGNDTSLIPMLSMGKRMYVYVYLTLLPTKKLAEYLVYCRYPKDVY